MTVSFKYGRLYHFCTLVVQLAALKPSCGLFTCSPGPWRVSLASFPMARLASPGFKYNHHSESQPQEPGWRMEVRGDHLAENSQGGEEREVSSLAGEREPR